MFQVPESFYEDASQYDDQLTFDNMNLSRPILKVTVVVGTMLIAAFSLPESSHL